MEFSFCSLASGSSGNCYMVKSGDVSLLVDVGISGKKIIEGLEQAGTEKEQVAGIFLTHEHSDHIKSLRVIGKKLPDVCAYANDSTWQNIDGCINHQLGMERREVIGNGKAVEIGGMEVKPFSLSHDAADPVGYSFYCGGRQISVVTDTGYVTDEIFEEIRDADLIVLEANHEVNMLEMGRYPYKVKRRILGEKGHLSNESAAQCICRLMEENPKKRRVLLGHLSRENNTPELAYITVRNILQEKDLYIGDDLEINIISRNEVSEVYQL